MEELLGSQVRGGGVIPPRPNESDCQWYRTFTTAQNFVVNQPGWYRFYVIGNGGNGSRGTPGYGDSGYSGSNCTKNRGSGGAGGAIGGYSLHEVHLNNEDVVQITADSVKWQIQIKDDIAYAENATTSSVVKSAAGGNILNHNGVVGTAGSYPCNLGGGGVRTPSVKYQGGSAPSKTNYCGVGAAATGTTTGSSTILGGAGGGGGASNIEGECEWDSGLNHWNDSTGTAYSGGSGFTGGVVVDIVAD